MWLLKMLAPVAPHMTEEMWQEMGKPYSIHTQAWPKVDEAAAKDEEITLVVQVNGKVRDRVDVPAGAPEEVVRAAALERPRVVEFVPDPAAARYHYVSDRLLSIVIAKG